MKFESLRVSNFGVFRGEHDFSLGGRGLCLVLGDNQDEPRMNSNGAGKSTLFDALDWCLWGKPPKGDHADSVVSEGEKACNVSVTLSGDGQMVNIARGRRPNGLTLTVNGHDHTALDTSETQAKIETLLGLDREVFHAAVLFGQTDMFNFCDAKDAERMSISSSVFQLEQIDEWRERMKERRNEVANRVNAATIESEAVQREWDTWQQVYVQALDAHTQWAETLAADQAAADEALSKARTNAERAAAQVPNVEELEAQRAAHFSNPPQQPDLSAVSASLAQAQAWAQQCADQAGTLGGQARAIQSQVKALSGVSEGPCPTCYQAITGDHLTQERAKLEHQAATVEQQADAARLQVDEARALAQQWQAELNRYNEAWHEQQLQHAQRGQDIDRQIAGARTLQQAAEHAQADVQRASQHWESIKGATNPHEARRAEATANAQRLGKALQDLKVTQADLGADLPYLDWWVAGFGPSGLKSYILDARLGELTDTANRWIGLLTGGTIWVRFESQRKGRTSGTLSNKLTVRVFRHNPDGTTTERNYRSWSGGEKRRVSLGVDFALSEQIAKRAKSSYDLLILDEVFKHLDQAGRDAVAEMLAELSRERSSVYVVDHDATFAGMFENRLIVRKHRGKSEIIEHEEA